MAPDGDGSRKRQLARHLPSHAMGNHGPRVVHAMGIPPIRTVATMVAPRRTYGWHTARRDADAPAP